MKREVVLARVARKKNPRTWIVVADGGQARILESETLHSGVAVRLDISSDARLTGGKLAAGRLPRAQESFGSARHGIQPRQSLKDHEKQLFVARLADYLKGGRGRFDQLVIVAPAPVTRTLLASLPESITAKVALTRKVDMTWMTQAEILERLGRLGAQLKRARLGA